MYLKQLNVHGLRNLEDVQLSLSPGANLFWGANGSGKTSILEAAYLLSRGRSFRTRHLRSVINHGKKDCTCFGLLSTDERQGYPIPMGVNRDVGGKFTFKVDGEPIRTASQLAETLPTQLLNNDSFQLLEGAPAQRRSFLDWGVFHVEHGYRSLWVRFQKCLKHRNSLLRHGRIDSAQLAAWDREFVSLARSITRQREEYLEQLLPTLQRTIDRLGSPGQMEFNFHAGWDTEKSLEQILADSRERDRLLGRTQWGPHRADIRVRCDGRIASEVMSRGQTKILITALKLAQGFHFHEVTGRHCIYLLDDLPAELDANHRSRVGRMLGELGVQVLVTGVDRASLEQSWLEPLSPAGGGAPHRPTVFHVEQGTVSQHSMV